MRNSPCRHAGSAGTSPALCLHPPQGERPGMALA